LIESYVLRHMCVMDLASCALSLRLTALRNFVYDGFYARLRRI